MVHDEMGKKIMIYVYRWPDDESSLKLGAQYKAETKIGPNQ
jgi:hypothetical protein